MACHLPHEVTTGHWRMFSLDPSCESCAKADGFREWVSLAAAGCTHLEPRVSVTLPYLLQQLSAGLPHQASSLQEILARLQGTRQNRHQVHEQALKLHSGVSLGFPLPLGPTAPPAPYLSTGRLCCFQQV